MTLGYFYNFKVISECVKGYQIMVQTSFVDGVEPPEGVEVQDRLGRPAWRGQYC
jgi:hypothetical protein